MALGAREKSPWGAIIAFLFMAAFLTNCSTEAGTSKSADDIGEARLAYQRDVQAYYESLVECFADLGVPTKLFPDGYGIEIGEDGHDFEAEILICNEQVGEHPDMPPPPSAEDISELYDLMLEVVGCLEREGLPFVDPPSREVYVESYLASFQGGGAPWWPYASPDGSGEAECPPALLEDVIFD